MIARIFFRKNFRAEDHSLTVVAPNQSRDHKGAVAWER
jgi:hypothetical protein